MKFRVIYDNLVTDDLIEEIFECATIEGAEEVARVHSSRAGLSHGNYDLFVEKNGTFTNVIDLYERGVIA